MHIDLDKTTHLVTATKGGVGKSVSASALTQFLRSIGVTVHAADADPQAPKLSKFKQLKATLLPLIENGEIKQSAFDPFFNQILVSKNCTLIDTGSGAFLPILKYMQDNRLYDLLKSAGKQLYFHVVITSGPDKATTTDGAIDLLQRTKGSGAKVVIWQNERDGIPMYEGKSIEETDWYKRHSDQVVGVVKIKDYDNTAFTKDLHDMVEEHLTYNEIMSENSSFTFMRKNRIQIIFNDIFEDLVKVFGNGQKTVQPAQKG